MDRDRERAADRSRGLAGADRRSHAASAVRRRALPALRGFLRDERGSVSIEFALWVPLFGLLLMITADASFMYLTMTRMENAARDAARQVSIGRLPTDQLGGYVTAALDAGPYSVSAACSTAEYACVRITRPVDSIVAFTVFGSLIGSSVGAETKMRLEPGVSL